MTRTFPTASCPAEECTLTVDCEGKRSRIKSASLVAGHIGYFIGVYIPEYKFVPRQRFCGGKRNLTQCRKYTEDRLPAVRAGIKRAGVNLSKSTVSRFSLSLSRSASLINPHAGQKAPGRRTVSASGGIFYGEKSAGLYFSTRPISERGIQSPSSRTFMRRFSMSIQRGRGVSSGAVYPPSTTICTFMLNSSPSSDTASGICS